MTAVHPSLLVRKIIHVDMDAFFAAIEVLDAPELKGKPVIVGGSPDSRGVVCTASYEARKFGVRSAMSCAKAARLCPSGIFVRPRFERYSEISRQIQAIMSRYTTLIEPLSLDEAYLDVTGNAHGLYAVEIAKRIRTEIARECGLTASAGVAPNKMLAKIASDLRKPNGLSVILPDEVTAFVQSLPLAKIHGIGPVSAKNLISHGLTTCGDVTSRPLAEIIDRLGESYGSWLYLRSQGIDDREVETERERKSFGQESTFQRDIHSVEVMRGNLSDLAKGLAESLTQENITGRTVTVKVRYPDFTTVTRASTLPYPTADSSIIADKAVELLARTEAATRGVRLLGISLSKLYDPQKNLAAEARQRSLFGD